MFKKTIAILFFSIVFLLFGCGAPQADIKTLKLGHSLDSSHPTHRALVYFSDRLAQLSNNSLIVDIYPGAQLGNERELLELLQIGSLSMARVSSSPVEGFLNTFSLFNTPYVFENAEHYWRVLDGEIGDFILSSLSDVKIKGLGFYDAGSRNFYANKHPIFSPSDLHGLKVRTQESPAAINMIKQFGGAATPLSWGELYTALQQGVVDAAENNIPSFYLSKHYETSRYLTLDEHTFVPDILMMNQAQWASLSEQEKSWVKQTVMDSSQYQRALWQSETQKAITALKAHGVQIIYPDKSSFMAIGSQIVDSYPDGDLVNLILAIKDA